VLNEYFLKLFTYHSSQWILGVGQLIVDIALLGLLDWTSYSVRLQIPTSFQYTTPDISINPKKIKVIHVPLPSRMGQYYELYWSPIVAPGGDSDWESGHSYSVTLHTTAESCFTKFWRICFENAAPIQGDECYYTALYATAMGAIWFWRGVD
jgi:hypothetical protein